MPGSILNIKIPNFSKLLGLSASRRKSAKKTVKKKRKLRKPRVLKAVDYQTGKRASLKLDRKRKALPPGKRISRTGKVYWETRRNRSDLRRGI
jgi:hypothetical protein